MLPILENAKNSKHEGPIIIHLKTKKVKDIHLLKNQMINIMVYLNLILKLEFKKNLKSNIPSYTKVFANTFIKHAEKDSKIVAITAAMPDGTG